MDRKTHSEGIDTLDIGVQCVQSSAKMLALHLAKVFPPVGWSLESVADLGNDDHNTN